MEKITLFTKERFVTIKNPFNEIIHDYMHEGIYTFEKGKIYGLICECGGGGEVISSLLSNNILFDEEKICIDDIDTNVSVLQKMGWYMGKSVYSVGIIKKERSVRQMLEFAIKKYNRYNCLDDIINEFHLKVDKLDYTLSQYSWEKWRASLAVGYASGKEIYCFPWMNTLLFYDCMVNSAVYHLFEKLKAAGSIIILPTSRYENVNGLADEIVDISSSRFKNVISENKYFVNKLEIYN